MNYRKYELLAPESIMTASTKTIDLKGLDPISRVNIQTLQTHASSDLMRNHVANIISKIQIVDGSTVLWDSSGKCCQAQDWYQGRQSELNDIYDDLEENSRCNFTLNFGRKLFDPDLGFDPSKYKNPQLKITHDHDQAGDVGDTAATLRIEIDVWDQKIPTLIGFLQFKEIFKKALVASGSEYIDLPVDLPIKSMMFQAQFASRRPTFQLHSLKLTEDNGKRIVMEDNLAELLPNLPTFRLFTERLQMLTAAGLRNIFCTPAMYARGFGTAKNTDDTIYCQPNDGGRIQIGCGAAAVQALVTVEGYCPHGAVSIPFGNPDDMMDWYETSMLDKLQLKLVASEYATNGNDQTILLEQLVKY